MSDVIDLPPNRIAGELRVHARSLIEIGETTMAMICNLAAAQITNPPTPVVDEDAALVGVRETTQETGGGWRPCSGCYDTEDGHPTQRYAFSKALGCDVGCGCRECGGIGATWEHWSEEDLAAWEESLDAADDDAIDAIQRLMDKKGLKRKDLFPAKSRASEYMSRKRPLSIAMIRKLHFDYGISAEVLIAPYREPIPEEPSNG